MQIRSLKKSTLTSLGVYQSLENTQKVHNKTGPIFTYFVQFFLGYPLMWNKLVLPWLALTVGSLLTRLTAHQLSMNIPQNHTCYKQVGVYKGYLETNFLDSVRRVRIFEFLEDLV